MNHLPSEGVSVTKNWFEEKASPPCKTSTSSFETEKVPAKMSKAQADQWHCPPPWTPTAPKSWWLSLTLKVFQARNAGLMNCLVGTWTNGLSDGQRSTPTVAYVIWETKQSVWKPHQTLYIYISLYDIIIWYVYTQKTLTSHHHIILNCMLLKKHQPPGAPYHRIKDALVQLMSCSILHHYTPMTWRKKEDMKVEYIRLLYVFIL